MVGGTIEVPPLAIRYSPRAPRAEVVPMPVEISVGTPVLSINHGSTFMVTDLSGEIEAESELGVFSNDTRFVSYSAISANGQPWVRLSSATTAYYVARIYLTNQAFSTEAGDVAAGALTLTISRSVGE